MTLRELPFVSTEEHSTTLLPLPTNEMWPIVRTHLRAEVGAEVFEQWFAGMKVEGICGSVVELSVPTHFLKTWITGHYCPQILRAWKEELPHITKVKLKDRGSVLLRTERSVRLPKSSLSGPRLQLQRLEARSAERKACVYPYVFGPYRGPCKLPTHTLIRLILCVVAAQFDHITVEDIQGPNRCKDWARARQVAMYLIHTHTPLSLPQIGGKWFDGRDHTTVLHGVRKIEWLIGERAGKVPYCLGRDPLSMPVDEELARTVGKIKELLKQYT